MSEGALNLYFDLKHGEKADLEVVAESVLHWVSALRAAASAIDPDAKVRVEFIDADEHSLQLNTILEWVETQLTSIDEGSSQYPRLRKLALALAVFVATSAIAPHLNIFDDPQVLSLSDEDRGLLKELIERTQSVPEVEVEGQKFFRVLERDPSISGVGVSEERDKPPAILIPSTEFPERSGLWTIEEDAQERTLRPILDVTLISPVLVKRPRSWKFQPEGLPEFTATMRDKRFLGALEEDHVRERLRTGIQMTIRLEVKEKKVDGDWVVIPRGRSVIEVISPKVD